MAWSGEHTGLPQSPRHCCQYVIRRQSVGGDRAPWTRTHRWSALRGLSGDCISVAILGVYQNEARSIDLRSTGRTISFSGVGGGLSHGALSAAADEPEVRAVITLFCRDQIV